jgi:hypothetical protein
MEKKARMRHRKNKKFCLFYPEDNLKTNWDLFITIVLIFTCIETPWRISFVESSNEEDLYNELSLASIIVDTLFFIDILIIFNCAYYDEDFNIIE